MAETKLIRDHHLLTRNLKLNDNYISNDGGDEGIRISDAGVVTASSQIDIGNMTLTTSELDVSSGDLTIDVAGDITLDAGGADVTLSSTTSLVFTQTSNDWVITNALNDADIIFNSLTSSVAAEVMRIDGSARSLLVASGKKVEFGASGDNISGTGSALTIEGGGDITLDAVGDIILDAGGNVGIGVADPDQALEVNGDIHVENTVYFTAETATTIVGDYGLGTINWNTSQKQKLTITGTSIAVNFTNPAGACNLLLKVVQGDGSDVIGTWDSDIKWVGGSAPTLSTGNGEIDILSFYFDGTNYFGVASLNFS